MSGHRKVRIAAAALATSALLGVAPGAQAQRPASLGEGAPVGQSGIQLYNFSSYLSNGAGEIVCPASPAPATPYCIPPLPPSTTMGRMERLFAFLQSRGVKNVELYGYPGNPFPSGTVPLGNPQGALELRALGDKYGIRFPARHGSLNEARWDAEITISRILGQDHVGESGPGGAGGVGSYQQTLRTAEQLNKLGKRSVEMGLGPAYFHNHAAEFGANGRFMDNGVLKSGWEILMERTDPRWVVAQIDIGWAVCGASGHAVPYEPGVGVAYVNAMIQKFGSRVISFHVKDMAADGIRPNCGNPEQRTLGQGAINFAPMLAAAKNKTKYYFAERDPVGIGGPTNFNPFNNTADSAVALKGDPAPTVKASPMLLPSVPAGTAAAANQMPMVVTNDGDAPLVISNATNAIQIQAEANDGGAATAADFAVVSEDCRGKTLAPGSHVHDQRGLQADAHELRVGRPRRDQLQRRRRDGAHPDRRLQHGRRQRHARRHRPDHARTEPAGAERKLRHVPARNRSQLRDGRGRLRDQHSRRRDAVGQRPEHDRSGPPDQRRLRAAAAAQRARREHGQPGQRVRRARRGRQHADEPAVVRRPRHRGRRHDRLPPGHRRR